MSIESAPALPTVGHSVSVNQDSASKTVHAALGPNVLAAAQTAIEDEFARRFARSVQLHRRAERIFPGGVTHDNRRVGAPSHFIRKARGARKIDQDGQTYVDYWVGHGSLLLGHGRQEVIEAVHLAAQDITHPGACHEREVLWGELVQQMVPSAERV